MKVNNKFATNNYILQAILVVTILVILGNQNVAADEVPAFFLKIAKNIPRIGRSEPHDPSVKDDDTWYKGNYLKNEVSKRKIGFSSDSDTWAWRHFPLAIEGPPELWRTLAGYSNDPLYRDTEDGFNNELWSRDKRASPQE